VALTTNRLDALKQQDMLLAANTLGLASDTQVFYFVNEPVVIKGVEPPPPFEVPINERGIQEVNLTITPGSYSPIRFAVKKGIPVKLIFRALGQVGCGNTLIFPADPDNPSALELMSTTDVQTLEFTPQKAGEWIFRCSNDHYRGLFTVRE